MVPITSFLGVILIVAACVGAPPSARPSTEPSTPPSPSPSVEPSTLVTAEPSVLSSSAASVPPSQTSSPGAALPLCNDVPEIHAPEDWYRDTPIYVSNEMPVEDVRDWAQRQPGYQDIWIDRDHLGWITVAFTHDVEQRQAELEREFPGVGVVAVHRQSTQRELEALQERAFDELSFATSSGILTNKGVVSIGIGVMTEERVAAVDAAFGGQPVCIEGMDPAVAPVQGPQPVAGDGWRLLADEPHVGQAYRTGIAWDDASYEALWREVRLPDERPPVEFQSEVVIWFGAVFGISCPNIRLDDVVVDDERNLIYADIVLLDVGGCTADANPHAYVVALERSRLPAAPFAIQLDEQGPPLGAPEERTVVDVDLSQPGAVAEPGEVHADPRLPEESVLGPGAIVEPGYPNVYRHATECGIEWLGPLNDVYWRTDVPRDAVDYIPPAWADLVSDGAIDLTVNIRLTPEPRLSATTGGHTIQYRAVADEPPACDRD